MRLRLKYLLTSCLMTLSILSSAAGEHPQPADALQPRVSSSSGPEPEPGLFLPADSEARDRSGPPHQLPKGGPVGNRAPGYSVNWYPLSRVSGQESDFGLVRQNLSLGMPVWREDGNVLIVTLGARHSSFFTDAILPDTLRPFPDELWNVRLGLNYVHRFENGWKGGIMPFFGSASDRPFHSIRELNLGMIAFLRVPAHCKQNAWSFSLFYSSASNLNFPIPGIAYSWTLSENLQVDLGIPFSLQWQPARDLKINVSWLPLTNVRANATWEAFQGFFLLAEYQFLNESWFLADRQRQRDRFMGFEQRILGGLRWNCWRNVNLDLIAGYVLDRFYGEGSNQGSRLQDRVNIQPGAFLGANVRLSF